MNKKWPPTTEVRVAKIMKRTLRRIEQTCPEKMIQVVKNILDTLGEGGRL
jgi:hypothetical protein